MRFVILLSALALLACGGETPVSTPDEAPAFATNYAVVKSKSEIRFSAEQNGAAFEGRFGEFDADIRFDADDLEASQVRVRIPLASIDAGSADRNSNLPGKVWFDTRSFPVATFESEDINLTGDGYAAMGTLSMKGTQQPVVVLFTLSGDDQGRTVMRGEAALDRTDWNVGEAPWDTEEQIGHMVTLDITLVAEKRD